MSIPDTDPLWVTTTEAAKRLGLSPRQTRRLFHHLHGTHDHTDRGVTPARARWSAVLALRERGTADGHRPQADTPPTDILEKLFAQLAEKDRQIQRLQEAESEMRRLLAGYQLRDRETDTHVPPVPWYRRLLPHRKARPQRLIETEPDAPARYKENTP